MIALNASRARKNLRSAKQGGRSAEAGRFLRIDDVIATTGLSRATIYRLLAANDFPAKVALTIRCVGWWEAEVSDWLKQRLIQSSKHSGRLGA